MRLDLNNPNDWIPKEVFKSYCGDKSEKLLSFYDKALSRSRMNLFSLNWMAILLLPAWLGYRKQWSILIALTIIFAGLPFLEAILSISIPTSGLTAGLIVLGLLANSMLLMNAQKDYHKLKQRGMDNEDIKNQLNNKVSPSVQYAVLSLLGYLAIAFGAAIMADTLFGFPY